MPLPNGLLALRGLSEGLKSGLMSYRDQQRYLDEKAENEKERQYKNELLKVTMAREGLYQDPSGEIKKKLSPDEDATSEESISRGLIAQKYLPEAGIRGGVTAGRYKEISPLIENAQKEGLLKQRTPKGMQATRGGLTPGEKKIDENYAASYNAFVEKGENNAANAIGKLEQIAEELESDKGLLSGGGRLVSLLPDAARDRDTIRRRDLARGAANTSLKELFGGQLSDAEREAAAREYWNDALDNEENAKIIRQKAKELRDNLETQREKSGYFREGGTLKGFIPSKKDPTPIAVKSANKPKAPKVGEVVDGYRFKGGDPGDQKNWEKQ